MTKYQLVGTLAANEQIFITKYVKGQDVQMLTMVEGVVYNLTDAQVAMLPRLSDGTIDTRFQVVA